MRSELELRSVLVRLRSHRKRYVYALGGDDYSKRLHHYIQCIEWVLEIRTRLHVEEIWQQVPELIESLGPGPRG